MEQYCQYTTTWLETSEDEYLEAMKLTAEPGRLMTRAIPSSDNTYKYYISLRADHLLYLKRKQCSNI